MTRDRIVVGVRDDATRRKLLQVRDLTLKNAIDICKVSEEAGRNLKAMAVPEDVQPLYSSPSLLEVLQDEPIRRRLPSVDIISRTAMSTADRQGDIRG